MLIAGLIGGVVGGLVGVLVGALAPRRPDGSQPSWARVATAVGIAAGLVATRPLTPLVVSQWKEFRARTTGEKYLLRLERELHKRPILVEWASRQGAGAFQEGTRVGAAGMLRLPDGLLVDVSVKYGGVLVRVDPAVCERMVVGAAGPEDAKRFFDAILEPDIDLFVTANLESMEAEIRGSPEPKIPSDQEVDEALDALQNVDEEGFDEHIRGFVEEAIPAQRCAAIRWVYMRLPFLPEHLRAPLARAVRM